MTKNDCEILQNLKIINLILDDIASKIAIDDFFVDQTMETVCKAIEDLNYVFNGGED